MENLISSIVEMGSDNAKSSYVSCIKIRGRPILPPLITQERLKELIIYKERAISIENRLYQEKQKTTPLSKTISTTSINSITDGSPQKQSTPNRAKSSKGYMSYSSSDESVKPNIISCSRSENNLCEKTFGEKFMNEEICCRKSEISENVNKSVSSINDTTCDNTFTYIDDQDKTSITLTPSPNLLRQNSYTLLEPSPVLLQYMESQRQKEEKRATHLGRKTWDFKRSRKDRPSVSPVCMDDIDYMDSIHNDNSTLVGLMDYQEGSRSVQETNDSTTYSPCSYNITPAQKLNERVKQKKTKLQKSAAQRQMQNQYGGVTKSYSKLVKVNEDLSMLSDLFMNLKMEHERQKRELEEKQKSEMKELELLFKKRESELIEAAKQNISVAESVRRPQSAKDCYSPCSAGQDSRRTRSMDFNQAVPGRDTDLDVSLQDSLQSRDLYVSKEYAADTDTVSNCSSHLSSMSSDSKLESMPLLDVKKFRSWDMNLEDVQKYNDAAAVITAAAKGFLTRRLLRTAHVQGLITTLRDAISCATQLHDASDLGESDVELMKRLGRQIEAAWEAVYSVFFETDAATKMQLISADRERLRSISSKTGSVEPKKRISKATLKSLRRKSISKQL